MTNYVIVAILVVALVTLFIRAFPFIVLAKRQTLPTWVQFMSRQLPKSIIVILIVYCLQPMKFINAPYGIPEGVALAAVVVLHLWKKHMIVSILVPTIIYMACIQYIF